ncbi:hypothetical protein FGKAn22_15390 [Ferrigenium kumadai]|uniref:Phosphoglycerate mutase n=1 Tax=Ferrigenium kumadai TaxID=1682490 RepID=A0AAN1W0P6_9PROT|nr:hypothetical protein [Ferrigenium kumadai]BBI99846.1 hypothetical protein FGKAn22_15390 [Ferrigenium kumadai]
MRSVRLVVPDLFLPREFAAEVCAGLRLPALEKMLSRGRSETVGAMTQESHLAGLFGLPASAGTASLGAAFDGLAEGHWLRADPVHLQLHRDRLVLQEVTLGADEANEFCASLNRHFSGEGIEFFAPHPQRWYVRLATEPAIETVPLSQAVGRNVRGLLPQGADAVRWTQLFNEIQMLLFAHELNERREARGEMPVNSVWLWGGGHAAMPQPRYRDVCSDDVLVGMFAAAAGVPFSGWSDRWPDAAGDGEQLLVWNGLRHALQRGDLTAWREALQAFEAGYLQPLWQALRGGRIGKLRLDVLAADGVHHVTLTRVDAWAFWRRAKPLAAYPMV